ncbi:histidine kinase [Streptomyces sp. NPDC048277]|uniref:sensor histidine kinase n=1 Tax=Streptomyces sp. NPDC048277 TaxID=3155027 RepID=UPI0033EA41E5
MWLERWVRGIGNGTHIGLGLIMAVALAFDMREITHTTAGDQWPFDLAVSAVICAIALLRGLSRTGAPVAGLAVYASATLAAGRWILEPLALLGGAMTGLAVLAASAARSLPPRRAVVIGAAGVIVMAAGGLAHTSYEWSGRANLALTGATIWAGSLALGVWLRHLDHRRHAAVEAVRREERLELARELHDVVAHHVTGILVQAQAARFTGEHDSATTDAFTSIESAGADTLAALRKLVGLLRDPADTTARQTAPESIDRLVERFTRHGPPVTLRAPDAVDWPPEIAGTLYRVVQEALTNVAHHAPDAQRVTVTITHRPQGVTVEVTDDAPATHARPRGVGGFGLIGMRERVETLGGTVRTGPLPHAGWAVHASLPVPAPTQP